MKKQLAPELVFGLSEYIVKFRELRPNEPIPETTVLVEEYEDIKNQDESNLFFGKYGVGNVLIGTSNPFDRMNAYESFLYILQTHNSKKFKIIHKGTPYYFIAWTAFQIKDFERALFYMDAAVSEDNRIQIQSLTPSTAFFLLDSMPEASGSKSLHTSLFSTVSSSLKRFNTDSGVEITIEDFINKFVKPIIYGDTKYRSVATGLYGFILEYERYGNHIFLRSSEGGSIELFINHLFKGARLLESILAMKGSGDSLYELISNLKKLKVDQKFLEGDKSLGSAKQAYDDLVSTENFQNSNFAASYIIRNTTGHSILWTDEFNRETYLILYTSLVNSIFWSIYVLWIE